MKKISIKEKSNNFCPQALFLYGTYREDGTPNFGLFCWFSYYWDTDLGVMACIGGDKLTKDLIRRNGVFSANLVSEKLLPLADYYGSHASYDEPDKMNLLPDLICGDMLHVPIIEDSPWSFELKVKQELNFDGGDIFLCEICNIMTDEYFLDENISLTERMKQAAPVVTCAHETYFALPHEGLGSWGEPQKKVKTV